MVQLSCMDSFSNPGYFIKIYFIHINVPQLLQILLLTFDSCTFCHNKTFQSLFIFFVTSFFLKTFFQTVNNKIRFQISFIILIFSVIVILHEFLFIQKTFIKETLRLRCMDNYINQKLGEGRRVFLKHFGIYGAISQMLITEMSPHFSLLYTERWILY